MNEDGHSDTTTDSSPATVRRVPLKSPKKEVMSAELKKQSSKDFIPQNSQDSMGKDQGKGQSNPKGRPLSASKQPAGKHDSKHSPQDDEEDDDEEYDDMNVGQIEGIYNPDDYKNLSVSPDIKELFSYIAQVHLPSLNSVSEVKLHPFIPDYYPSVGDIDAFVKVIEPGVKEHNLGVKLLDEPAPFQSDPSVLDLRLRALSKQTSANKVVTVKTIENLGKNIKVIENWTKDISDLHRSKPSPSVHYSKPMPDIDLLLAEWPPEMEELLKDMQLPGPDLNCDLASYVDIVCNILDIPVHKNRIHSLHVIFTLFSTMRQFSSQFGNGVMKQDDFLQVSNSLRILDDDPEVDRLHIS